MIVHHLVKNVAKKASTPLIRITSTFVIILQVVNVWDIMDTLPQPLPVQLLLGLL